MDPEIEREYREFVEGDPLTPPKVLSESVLACVKRGLSPSAWHVFGKLALIHFFTALATLSLCPQFGIKLFGSGLGLMKFFMELGDHGCMAACGALFVGASLLVAGFALRPEEVRALRKHEWLQISAVTFLSLGSLAMIARTEILVGFALSWAMGSLIGGFLMLETSWGVRQKIAFNRAGAAIS